jgi:pyridinium-3,5-bisthiocarboxylic acid mononucleotide nickel chelatase
MTTGCWFHCFSGIAGDMALASLIDAGASVEEVRKLVERLPVGGWELTTEPVMRGGIAATHVRVDSSEDAVVRTYAHITALVDEARLPDRVRERSQRVFTALAEVEGRLHRRPPAQVHFHEVGGLDAIVDIVGTCAALEVLGVDEIHASAVATGTGMVRTSHGMLPVPAPAVVELLRGAPTYGHDMHVELTTPTGAALLAGLAAGFGPLPSMTITATGFGAGTRIIDELPNLTQVVIGELLGRESSAGQPVVLLEVNVDDATGETLAHAIAALLDAGAHDAWVTPILMKRGRPGHTVAVLADPSLVAQLAGILAVETGSLGVRTSTLARWPQERRTSEVDVGGVPVRVKVSAGRVKVEARDAERAARRSGIPFREVVSRAEQAWRDRIATTDLPPDDAS